MFIGIPSLSALRTPLEEYLVSTFRQRPPAFTIYGSLSTTQMFPEKVKLSVFLFPHVLCKRNLKRVDLKMEAFPRRSNPFTYYLQYFKSEKLR
jgi:hypothetical protein